MTNAPTPFAAVHRLVLLWLALLVGAAALASPLPVSAGDPIALAGAPNLDGTLRPGMAGSFDARPFTMQTAPAGRPVFRPTSVSGTAGAGDEKWLSGFGLPGADGPVYASLRVGNDLYVGGQFSAIGHVVAHGLARWNGSVWSPVGTSIANGVDGIVYSLALAPNGDLYVGGYFSQASGALANHIARWNGTAWSSLGSGTANGMNNGVRSLALAGNGDVYAGGDFTQAGGATANGVARWNGTAWSTLGTGLYNASGVTIGAVALLGNDLYVGGSFTQAGGLPANNIARWNGTTWNSLGTGAANGTSSGRVTALAVVGSTVYVGGLFLEAGGLISNNLARWSGTVWSTIPNSSSTSTGTSAIVLGLNAVGSDLYVSGLFSAPGQGVAKWNGTAWSQLGAGIAYPGSVWTVAVLGSTVYVGGRFTQAGGVLANGVARWNGAAWQALAPLPGQGLSASIGGSGAPYALAVAPNGDVYVGTGFNQAGGTSANGVARWNGTTWSPLGTGTNNGISSLVATALAVGPNGDLYVGGQFTQAGGVAAANVARWNGTTWNALGTGMTNGPNGYVRSLVVAPNGDVYVGGTFTQAGGVATNGVARWNGTAWSSLGTGIAGVNPIVNTLALAPNGDLYVGGQFTQAGGVAAINIARWNGTAWSALGTGPNTQVCALATVGSTVYVGGTFTQAGGLAANHIARWNGTTWSALGTGMNNTRNAGVYALAVTATGDLYAGGEFTQAGGVAANRVARWNGTAWSPLGTGLNAQVRALATRNSQLCVGGEFAAVGDESKVSVRFALYDPAIPSASASATTPVPLRLYPNPARSFTTLTMMPGPAARPVLVLDALGRQMRRATLPAHAATLLLDSTGLPPGCYTVRCGSGMARLVVE